MPVWLTFGALTSTLIALIRYVVPTHQSVLCASSIRHVDDGGTSINGHMSGIALCIEPVATMNTHVLGESFLKYLWACYFRSISIPLGLSCKNRHGIKNIIALCCRELNISQGSLLQLCPRDNLISDMSARKYRSYKIQGRCNPAVRNPSIQTQCPIYIIKRSKQMTAST